MRLLHWLGRGVAAALALSVALGLAGATRGQTIIDEWGSVKAPPPPELKPVTIDPKTTALLVLDLLKQQCNDKRRPRCVASIPKVRILLNQARAQRMLVVYSIFPSAKLSDILPQIAPLGGDPHVAANADKFIGTDLDKILKDHGIKTVIVVGTAAQGALLYTASDAAFRGFGVIVPVDGTSSESTYMEQYVAFQLTHAPGVSNHVTLTRIDMIKF